jgi:GntR family transcriptional regulator
MLRLHLTTTSGVPAYRQIMDQFMHYIAAGTLGQGAQLPSIRELARELRVNPTTVVKAYSELEHQGAIDMQQGKGAFVASSREIGMTEREQLLRAHAQTLAVEARQLGVPWNNCQRILREAFDRLDMERPK